MDFFGHPITTNNKEAAKVVANAASSPVASVNTESLDSLMSTTSSGHKLSEKEKEAAKEGAKKSIHDKRVQEKKKALEEEMLNKALEKLWWSWWLGMVDGLISKTPLSMQNFIMHWWI